MVGRMGRPIAVLAMVGALLAATPVAASATTARPAVDVRPTAVCNVNPPPVGYSFQSSHATCMECLTEAFRWESTGRRAHCRIVASAGRVDLYLAPVRPS